MGQKVQTSAICYSDLPAVSTAVSEGYDKDKMKGKNMSQMDFRILPMLQTAAIITLVALAGYGVSQAASPDIKSVTFFVG